MNTAVEPSEAVGMNAKRLERIRPAMQAYVDRGVYAGINTLVARRGRVVHAAEFGWRDKEAGQAMTADTIFRLYSQTKPVICTALMTLLEEGRFRLIEPLAKYIPAFGAVKVLEADGHLVAPVRPILIRDVMTHMSGLTYHFVEESGVGKMYTDAKLLAAHHSLEAAIDDLARFPLAFQPGMQWRYSVGIDVAARLIEVISGRPLGAFLRERLCEPLGMADTAFGVAPEKRNRLAAMYGRPDIFGGVTMGSEYAAWLSGVNDRIDVVKSYPVDSPEVFVRGGHGLFSTIGDYFRFAQMLANGGELDGERILGRKTLELMHSNHVPASLLPLEIGGLPLPGYGFGLGSRVLLDVAQSGAPGSVGEFGWSGAAKTHYWVDPKEELVGLFMTQSMMSF
ncbi:MAG: beta-lactamase family protein, partial [Hyphomicrobiales bacterium]|nr:beta-lactamase family protein [Hyphomicrobiales bacterium]